MPINNFTFISEDFVQGPNGLENRRQLNRAGASQESINANTVLPAETFPPGISSDQNSNSNNDEEYGADDTANGTTVREGNRRHQPSVEPQTRQQEETDLQQQQQPSSASANRLQWGTVAIQLLVDFMYETYGCILGIRNNNTKHRLWSNMLVLFKEYLIEHRQSATENLARFAQSLNLSTFMSKWSGLKAQYQTIASAIDATGSGGVPGHQRMPFFDKIGATLKDDPAIHPLFTIETTFDGRNAPPRVVRRDGYPFDETRVDSTDPELKRRIQEDILAPLLSETQQEDLNSNASGSQQPPRQRRRRNNGTARPRSVSPSPSLSEENERENTRRRSGNNRELHDILEVMCETNAATDRLVERMETRQAFLEEKAIADKEMYEGTAALIREEIQLSTSALALLRRMVGQSSGEQQQEQEQERERQHQ